MTALRLTRAVASGPGRSQPRILHTASCPEKPAGTVRYQLPDGMTVADVTARFRLVEACPRCLGPDGRSSQPTTRQTRKMTRYVIRAAADSGCAVSVDLTGDQYLAVRHVVEGIDAQPGWTPSMSIHLPADFADTYGDSYELIDLGPVPTQPVVPHAAVVDPEPDEGASRERVGPDPDCQACDGSGSVAVNGDGEGDFCHCVVFDFTSPAPLGEAPF